MSAEATGWVFKHSPLTGIDFTIHLAIADSVNSDNHDRFWMKQANLADKARTTRGSVNRCLARMVEMGLLEPVDNGLDVCRAQHASREYRMLMPMRAQRASTETDARSEHMPCVDSAHGDARSARIVITQGEPNSEPNLLELVPPPLSRFEDFWDAFGLKKARPVVERAWHKAIKTTAPEVIIEAAIRYREWCISEDVKQKYPQGWLNDRRWEDDLTPVRKQTRTEANRRNLAAGLKRMEGGDTIEARLARIQERKQRALAEGTNHGS